jgi:predicted tellurium resistance membrane protein TerC
LFITLTEKYPVIIDIGAAVLAWTAAKMLVSEKMWETWFDEQAVLKYALEVGLILAVYFIGRTVRNQKNKAKAA